jgi:VIT1/CCC1 family predicted Fe2+/Mn2+ transporter
MLHNLHSSGRVLDPIDRISEVLFGLIMVLTFTGSLSVAETGREEVRTMLIGALGCNIAWGIIDAILYLMGCLTEQAHARKTLQAIQATTDQKAADRIIREALPRVLATILSAAEIASIHERLKQGREPDPTRLHKHHWKGAIGVFLLVFLSTFPVAVPFLIMHNAIPALRVSNVIAVSMLFLTGFAYGRITSKNPWMVGFGMVVLGSLLVGMAIALGG